MSEFISIVENEKLGKWDLEIEIQEKGKGKEKKRGFDGIINRGGGILGKIKRVAHGSCYKLVYSQTRHDIGKTEKSNGVVVYKFFKRSNCRVQVFDACLVMSHHLFTSISTCRLTRLTLVT